jgi:hypothetical protein
MELNGNKQHYLVLAKACSEMAGKAEPSMRPQWLQAEAFWRAFAELSKRHQLRIAASPSQKTLEPRPNSAFLQTERD